MNDTIDDETLQYPKFIAKRIGLGVNEFPAFSASNRAGIDGRNVRPEIKPKSLFGDPLNDPGNPRYGSAGEAVVVAERRGLGGGAEMVRRKSL